jgi:hypothetical protein
MTTVHTRLQFNVRKKRLHSSKLNTGKENNDCENKRFSALSAFHEHGRKSNESKCEDSLPKQILLLDDGNDSDSDVEGKAAKQHVSTVFW